MSTPAWQPGHLYPPGSLVVPRTAPASMPQAIPNPGFEDGDEEWNKTTGWSIVQVSDAYQGSWIARYSGTGESGLHCDTEFAVVPGQSITLSCYYRAPGGGDGAGGRVVLVWLDADKNLIKVDGPTSNFHRTGPANNWRLSSITASAPAGARFVRPTFSATINTGGDPVDIDSFTWNYKPPVAADLQYKAVQAAAGYSDNVEPSWPGVLGQTVIDNEVIWEAVSVSRVVWEARPILRSGVTEPTWPTESGANVADNTISWEAVSRRVEDEKCPQSKHVVIAASKVFAGDEDIIAYSATVNPLDWSSPDNAGYLPFGLQLYGANPVSAMGLYRGNVVAFNVQGGQVWQVDEDPALMQLLDAFPIGTQYHHSLAPVTNDLFMLTQLGVRTLGVAAGSTNLQAGDVGMPIDPMVRASLDEANANGIDPEGLYNPNAGQYWLLFPGLPSMAGVTLGYVYTMNRLGQIGAWTRYEFPFPIDDWAIMGEHLYVRSGDTVRRVSTDRESDEMVVDGGIERVAFDWTVQWPWLDFGAMGVTKMMQGFDIIGTGECRIQFGYDQTDGGRWTPEWQLIADSVPGQLLPMPLAAPSLAVKLTYTGSDTNRTGWDAINLHFTPFRETS